MISFSNSSLHQMNVPNICFSSAYCHLYIVNRWFMQIKLSFYHINLNKFYASNFICDL